jgi:hypothetical protein
LQASSKKLTLRRLHHAPSQHGDAFERAEREPFEGVYVSRLERRADMKLSTLREYVRALGGDLQLMVTFPGDELVKLQDIGMTSARKRRSGQKSKMRKIA